MLDKRMEEALNKQFNAEVYSAYLYLSMSAHFEDKNLPGFAHWMKQQVQEEMFHGMKFYGFIIDRGGRVDLKAIEAPPAEWSSAVDVFTETLKHERYVTSLINELASLATELNDQASQVFLHWFVNEQVEEEATADEWLQKVKMVESNPGALYFVDREALQRTFNLAGALAGGGQ